MNINIPNSVPKVFLGLIYFLCFSVTVLVWAYLLYGMSEWIWAPWDTALVRPPEGHWQAKVNWFFETGPGTYLPALSFCVAQVLLYALVLWRYRKANRTSVIFAGFNLASFGLLWLLLWLIPDIAPPAYLTPEDWQYYGDYIRELPYTLIILGLIVSSFVMQYISVARSRRMVPT